MKSVRSVERAISILFLVAESDHPLGLSEISRGVGFDKATALRLLATLEQMGLVLQEKGTRRYMLGPSAARLSRGFRTDIRAVARPFIESLWREVQETITLNAPRGVARIVIECIPANHEFSIVPAIGSAVPIHMGATGKALMAWMHPEQVEQIVRECAKHPESEYAVPDADDLYKKLRSARRHGYAWSIGDVYQGSAAVSAPVFDHSGNVAVSLTIRGPHVRLNRQKLIQLAPPLMETAHRLSVELGYEPSAERAVGLTQ